MIEKIKTKDMHCRSCEKIIEKAALSVQGVKTAKSDFAKEETEVEFDESITSIGEIMKAIAKEGHRCELVQAKGNKINETEAKNRLQAEEKGEGYYNFSLPKANSKYFLIGGGLLFLLGLIWLLKYAFSFNLPEITPDMGLLIIFTVGILTSFHCIGMCGGFVLSYTTKDAMDEKQSKKSKLMSHLKYGAGKTITYTFLGALFGLLGSFIAFTPALRGIAALIAGVFLIIYGINMLNVFPWLRKLQFREPKFLDKMGVDAVKAKKGPFVVGIMNGFMLACGPLQAMLIYAAGTGSIFQGALALFVFGLGTLPLMLGFGSIATIIGSKFTNKILKFSAVIVIVLGIVMLNRGLTLTGSGYDIGTLSTSVTALGSNGGAGGDALTTTINKDGYQEIRMDVLASGWSPNKFVLKKGVPVRWIINGKEITGCNNAIQAPKLNLNFDIKKGEQIIEFTPTEEGIIPWSCWMGMKRGSFIVKSDIDINNQEQVQKELNAVNVPAGGSCGGGGGGCGCGGARR